MYENRKDNGQLVKVLIELGESDRGIGRLAGGFAVAVSTVM
jgi:hypothetical protein